jgi:hypothetical protein
VFVQGCGDADELSIGEAVVLAQTDRAFRAVEVEERLMLGANDVNVCWPVVVRVDDSSKVANSQDGRHMRRIHIPKRLGYFGTLIELTRRRLAGRRFTRSANAHSCDKTA